MNEVLYTIDNGVGQVVINRPERSNALNGTSLRRLREIVHSAGIDTNVRVVTITGAGERVFCAGADLRASLPGGPESEAFDRAEFRLLMLEISGSPKPTIALARGHVLGGGMGILLACDLALACDDIHLSTPEIKVGMFPMIVSAFLFRRISRRRATEMVFMGDRMSASTALECGILNRVYPRNQFEAAASEYAGNLASRSSSILRLGKEAIYHLEDRTLPGDLEYLESALARVMESADSKEGIRAFIEKREPKWTHS